jgi:hypothetical protein
MKTFLSRYLFLSFLAAPLAPNANAAVQIYISYIDNETRAVLTSIVKHQTESRPADIFAIDGRGMEDGEIFSSNYGANPTLTDLTTLRGEKIEAVRLSPDGPMTKNISIVVLPPVNGRYPAELKEYLGRTLKALARLPQASAKNGGIRVVSFGTAGGVNPSRNPGEIVPAKSSLFVGTVSGRDGKPVAMVKFSSLGDTTPPIVLYSKEFPSVAAAENAAQSAFSAWAIASALSPEEATALISCVNPIDQILPGYQSWMTDIASALVQTEIRKGQTSLTTSFFAGPEFKSQANLMGFSNVNMEDSHLIEELNANKISASISRMISDPPALDPKAESALRNWYSSATYSEKKYEDAILWGLRGADIQNPPDSARWNVFSKFPAAKAQRWIDQQKISNGMASVDPFYFDIARSFLNSARSGNVLDSYVNENGFELSEKSRSMLNRISLAISAKAEGIQEQYNSIAHGQMSASQEQTLRNSIKELIDSLSRFPVRDEPLRTELLKSGKVSEIGGAAVLSPLSSSAADGSLRVWRSHDSNYSSISQATDLLSAHEPTSDQINRAVYVHVRTFGLPLAADVNTQRESGWLNRN